MARASMVTSRSQFCPSNFRRKGVMLCDPLRIPALSPLTHGDYTRVAILAKSPRSVLRRSASKSSSGLALKVLGSLVTRHSHNYLQVSDLQTISPKDCRFACHEIWRPLN